VSVINTAALVTLGILVLRKVVLMERYFEVRVYLITAFMCGLLLFAFSYVLSDPTCYDSLPTDNRAVFRCTEM
jgi:hypothetical protein